MLHTEHFFVCDSIFPVREIIQSMVLNSKYYTASHKQRSIEKWTILRFATRNETINCLLTNYQNYKTTVAL